MTKKTMIHKGLHRKLKWAVV